MAIRTAVNRALTAITALPTAAALTDGNLTLLTTATASSSATLDFTSSINSTYNSYLFKFINIHPASDDVHFQFQTDTGTNTSYNQAVTSTSFTSFHFEDNSAVNLTYNANLDQAQGTGFQIIKTGMGNDNDQSVSGSMCLFNPSSTVFVKHFMSDLHNVEYRNASFEEFKAGYFNTTTALTRVRFKMSSGNMDSGTIKMYGVGPKQ